MPVFHTLMRWRSYPSDLPAGNYHNLAKLRDDYVHSLALKLWDKVELVAVGDDFQNLWEKTWDESEKIVEKQWHDAAKAQFGGRRAAATGIIILGALPVFSLSVIGAATFGGMAIGTAGLMAVSYGAYKAFQTDAAVKQGSVVAGASAGVGAMATVWLTGMATFTGLILGGIGFGVAGYGAAKLGEYVWKAHQINRSQYIGWPERHRFDEKALGYEKIYLRAAGRLDKLLKKDRALMRIAEDDLPIGHPGELPLRRTPDLFQPRPKGWADKIQPSLR
jgi:hypothetical protein